MVTSKSLGLRFSSQEEINTYDITAGNSAGSQRIQDGTKMKFNSTQLAPMDGDQNIILDSTFNYVFDDVRFELTRTIDTIKYDYEFIRY